MGGVKWTWAIQAAEEATETHEVPPGDADVEEAAPDVSSSSTD
jgi:hypothetical protein